MITYNGGNINNNANPLPVQCCPPNSMYMVCVTSLNGLTGDVQLRGLKVGDKVYNGSSDIEITAEDLGLNSVMRYKGVKYKDQIEKLKEPSIGDLYYCPTDKLYYLYRNEDLWGTLLSEELFIEQIERLDKSDVDLSNQIEVVTKFVESVDEKLISLSATVEEVSERLINTISRIDIIEGKVSRESEDIAELYQITDNLALKQVVLDHKITDLSETVETYDYRIAEAEEISKKAEEDVKHLEKIVQDETIEIDNLARKQVVLDHKIEHIQDDIDEFSPIVQDGDVQYLTQKEEDVLILDCNVKI